MIGWPVSSTIGFNVIKCGVDVIFMYDNFVLRRFEDGKIEGYSWSVEDPGKVVCIVHGIGEYGGRFDRVAEAFRRCGIAVLSIDLRGHGNSAGKKGDCAPRKDVLDDITELIKYAEKLYCGSDIVLYGHSMGGNIVLDYRCRGELRGDVSGYIVTAPWIRLVRPVPKILYRAVKAASGIIPTFIISSEVNEKYLGNPESVKPYHDNPMVHNKISLRCAVDGYETGMALEKGDSVSDEKTGRIPLLLMHGDKDRICNIEGSRIIAERMEKSGENIEYGEWKELFHEIHNGGEKSNGDEVIEKAVKWTEML